MTTELTKPIVLDETGQEIVEELKKANEYRAMEVVTDFDGTKATYDKLMRKWFLANGVNVMTPSGITDLCNKWYTLTKDGFDGRTTFAKPSESNVSTGTRGGDNYGKTCTPSTDTTAGTDDFEGLPLFACVDVNFTVDPTSLDIVITAIDGITDNFRRTDPTKFVGVMQMAGWHYWYEDSTTYTHGYADHRVPTGNCAPLPEAVRADGTLRPFVVHAKYMSHTVSGKLTSYSGAHPTPYISHNSLHTLSASTGAQYSGTSFADLAFLVLMTYIKYASLTLDGIMGGCNGYDIVKYAQVSETAVKRVIVPASSGFEAGSTVVIGTYNGSSTDRGASQNYSISGSEGATILSVESITVDGTTYDALYVDVDTAFNTVANGDATSGSTIVMTFHWRTGMTDGVKGNDGSFKNNTDNKHPFKLQGIECMLGGYEVVADVIMNEAVEDSVTYYTPYAVNRTAKQATSITADYVAFTALKIACAASAAWRYIKRLGFQDGMFYPIEVDGSSSTFTKDAFYMDANGTSGTREWLAFGRLTHGSYAGLSCLLGDRALSDGGWGFLGRLSPNGNRGEWAV